MQNTISNQKIDPLKLEGRNIYLRRVSLNDVNERYHAWLNDEQVNQYLETRFDCQSIDTIRQYVQERLRTQNELLLAICLKKDDKHIGNIKLGRINRNHRFADISLFIGDRDQWGKGYATEAISLITQYSFHELKLNKLTAGCYDVNIGSMKAFQKAGYRIEGRLKKQYQLRNKYVDRICLGYVNEQREKISKEE